MPVAEVVINPICFDLVAKDIILGLAEDVYNFKWLDPTIIEALGLQFRVHAAAIMENGAPALVIDVAPFRPPYDKLYYVMSALLIAMVVHGCADRGLARVLPAAPFTLYS